MNAYVLLKTTVFPKQWLSLGQKKRERGHREESIQLDTIDIFGLTVNCSSMSHFGIIGGPGTRVNTNVQQQKSQYRSGWKEANRAWERSLHELERFAGSKKKVTPVRVECCKGYSTVGEMGEPHIV